MAKSILIIIPYEKLYPPTNGGMQRAFHIFHQLCKHFKITAIIHQDKTEFLFSINSFPEIANATIYSTADERAPRDLFSSFPDKIRKALRYRWYKRSFLGPADGHFLLYYPILKKLLKNEKFDIVILEKLSTLNAVRVIRKNNIDAQIIYDAHNVDSYLALAEKNEHYSLIYQSESSLYRKVDRIIACSQNDLVEFVRMNQDKIQGTVVPNGVHIEDNLFDKGVQLSVPEYILFCGSVNYRPNSDGLLWFYNEIWPRVKSIFPYLKLLVVGSGKPFQSLQMLLEDNSVIFTGTVSDVKIYYNKASIVIVPLKTGSGTRLKVLEAMSLGLPIVSTSKGAEGIEYTDKKDIIIADDKKSFAEQIIYLLGDKEERLRIQQKARKLVEKKYDWKIIGKEFSNYLFSQTD